MGVRSDKFAKFTEGIHLDLAIEEAVCICPSINHPFFIIEGKSDRGHYGEAENYARRGGAVLVNVNRSLRAMAGEPSRSMTR